MGVTARLLKQGGIRVFSEEEVPEAEAYLRSLDDARTAAANGVYLEITSRRGHSLTNGHVARIAREQGWFDIDDVCDGISEKMIRRHPHVFGDRKVSGSAEVLQNWEDIKRDERAATGESSVLDGVPDSLPALLKAYRITEKAAAVGFDWRKPADVMVKMHEEMAELADELVKGEASANERVRAEMGDVLFVMANLARHLQVEPETALQGTNATFMRRFKAMEKLAQTKGRNFRDMDLAEQDDLWEEVKEAERRGRKGPGTGKRSRE